MMCSPRLVQGSELLYEVEVAGPPLCVALNGPDGGEWGHTSKCCDQGLGSDPNGAAFNEMVQNHPLKAYIVRTLNQ